MSKIPVILIIIDGFGYDKNAKESPWQLARHPNISEIEKYFPFTTIQASGLAAGLPWGKPGNSEVGHLTMGAGRIIYNHLPRIITAVHDGSFFENEAFVAASGHVKKYKGKFHIMGLFSSGSVHAYADHLYALLDFTKRNNIEEVYLHLFTDGRDAPPTESASFFKQFEDKLKTDYPCARLASVTGRHFAMDRDGKWENIEMTYRLLTERQGKPFISASDYIGEAYKKGVVDEFIEPAYAESLETGGKTARVGEGDAMIFFNYREDSAREITSAFVQQNFDKFRRNKITNLAFVTMTQYSPDFPVLVAFPPLEVGAPIAEVVSLAGLNQLHIAETEKYAHVTYFFNGGKENPFPNEDRILVPSPRTPHYDDVPEMSAYKITEKILTEMGNYSFIVVNFANADMVGHTGNLNACITAIEVLDDCVGRVVSEVFALNGKAIITADHGNVEEKIFKLTGEKRTSHTTNPVPFYLIGKDFQRQYPLTPEEIINSYKEVGGVLADVAPTVLDLLNLVPPKEMTGKSLLGKLIAKTKRAGT